MIRSIAFALALVSPPATLAIAQTADEQAACKDDAFESLPGTPFPTASGCCNASTYNKGCDIAGMPCRARPLPAA